MAKRDESKVDPESHVHDGDANSGADIEVHKQLRPPPSRLKGEDREAYLAAQMWPQDAQETSMRLTIAAPVEKAVAKAGLPTKPGFADDSVVRLMYITTKLASYLRRRWPSIPPDRLESVARAFMISACKDPPAAPDVETTADIALARGICATILDALGDKRAAESVREGALRGKDRWFGTAARLAQRDPNLTNREIARRLRIDPSQLSRPGVAAALKAVRSWCQGQPRRGYRDSETGDPVAEADG